MGNYWSSSGEAAGRDNSARWYPTDHFKERKQERRISHSSIRRAIMSGRCEPGRDGVVKRSSGRVAVLVNEKRRSLITAYRVGKPKPEPEAGWGSLITMGLWFVGGVLVVTAAMATRKRHYN